MVGSFSLGATLTRACWQCRGQDFLDPADVRRVSKIEVLDEVEEWELIMVSYVGPYDVHVLSGTYISAVL